MVSTSEFDWVVSSGSNSWSALPSLSGTSPINQVSVVGYPEQSGAVSLLVDEVNLGAVLHKLERKVRACADEAASGGCKFW